MVYPIAKRLIPPIYNLWVSKVSGIENIPKNEPFIIALNHSSYYDTLLPYTIMVPILDKQIHALVNSTYFNNPFFKFFLVLGKCIPVYVKKNIKSKMKNKESLKKAINFLNEGDLIQIFPEGTRSKDGKIKKAYTGVAKLVLKSKVPVLPFGVIDSRKVIPGGKIIPRFSRAKVNIGKPLYFKQYYNKDINKKILEKITREIMKEIAKLIGQKYHY